MIKFIDMYETYHFHIYIILTAGSYSERTTPEFSLFVKSKDQKVSSHSSMFLTKVLYQK